MVNLFVRCSMAAARSCPTSTHPLTLCTAHRDWPSLLTDTLLSLTLATTASKCTATCSSSRPWQDVAEDCVQCT